MNHLRLLSFLLSFLTLSAAFPWPDISPFEAVEGILARRQDNGDESSSRSNTRDSEATTTRERSSASQTDKSSSASATDKDSKNTKSASGSDKTTKGASKTTDKPAKSTEYDPRLPAGGVSMITPAALAGPQYYKIGDWVTFAWNYTSVSSTPKHVDVLASCSANSATYTLAVNQTVHPTQKILWDTGEYQKTATVPLLTETYTLIVYDAESSISATPKAGYLGVFDQWTFGMYVPQSYTPLSGYKCATCSGAMTSMERQTLAFLFGMGSITVLTFTWFANSFGLF